MKRHIPAIAILIFLFLGACSTGGAKFLGVTTNGAPKTVDVTRLPSMRVVGLVVVIPETLVASESNSYKPIADIVWREDPFGDRHQQVQTIFEDAISAGVASLQGDLPVVLHIEVTRFHALTQRTRYSIGGVHEIEFLLTVTNGRTGDTIIPSYQIITNLQAFGGAQALAAERVGLTQKVRISEHLAALIKFELTGVPVENLASVPGGPTLEFGQDLGDELSPFIRSAN